MRMQSYLGRIAGFIRFIAKWLLLAAPLAAIVGSAVAIFLWLLDLATNCRWDHPLLLWLLPLAGVGVGLLYHHFGEHAERGNNLIIEQIHQPGGGLTPRGVPAIMGPLVLAGTLITHLFGGSAGREGTAVQMGGSIAGVLGRLLRLNPKDTSTLLMCGIAGGFGAVFGTPFAGAIFAIEVVRGRGRRYGPIVPCLIAAIAGDRTTIAWGIHHTRYVIESVAHGAGEIHFLDGILLAKVALAGVAFGLASMLFSRLAYGAASTFKRLIPHPALRPAVGGLIVIALVYLLGTHDYLGLGVVPDPHHLAEAIPGGVSIVGSFHAGGATPLSWWWKTIFTTITLGSGFKGDEVTPLFFIGATLGNTLATLLQAPAVLFAALGFVAVFAGATKTPLACTVMAIELFGPGVPSMVSVGFAACIGFTCLIAHSVSGRSTIYGTSVKAHSAIIKKAHPE